MTATTPFMDMIEIIEDVSEYIPEGLLITIYNKLKECKDVKERRPKVLRQQRNIFKATSEAYKRHIARRNVKITRDTTINKLIIKPESILKPGDTVKAEWYEGGRWTGKYFPAKIISLSSGNANLPDNWPLVFGNQKYALRFDDNPEKIHSIIRERIYLINTAPPVVQQPELPVVRPLTPSFSQPQHTDPWHSRFAVIELKCFCRDNRIRGYSNLNKQGIQRLIYDNIQARAAVI